MSTVRFRLDNEQLPFTSTASSYQSPKFEKESKFISIDEIRRNTSPYEQTSSEKFAKTVESSRPGHSPFFQSNGQASGHSISPVYQYSGTSIPIIPIQKMDGAFLQHSSHRLHETSNYKPIQQELFNGRMERPTVNPSFGQWSDSPKHDLLGRPKTGNTLPSDPADTDLCLSMVHETRPSYQMKVAGKHPLSPPHLASLIEQGNRKQDQFHAYYSPSFNQSAASPNQVQNDFSPSYPKSFSPSNNNNKSAYGQSHQETSAYKLSQQIARETPPPTPPPPPPLSAIRSQVSSSNSPVTSTQPVNYRSDMDNRYSHSKPSRTFNDFEPDDILKDLRNFPAASPGRPTFQTSNNSPITTVNSRPTISPGQRSVVSPRARGLAPPPTDQPVRCPAMHGIEANVDALTIRMIRNMETGYGAAGPTNCTKCGEGIFNNRPGCVAMDKTYHIECFTCQVCNLKLSGSPFYAVDDKHYCEKDYIDTLDKCDTCHRPIKDKILRASGKAYHPQCFACASCFRELDGIPFTVDTNNVNYCMQCFHEKFAPRCAACHKPIAPVEGQKETTRIVAMDRSYHVACYACEDCALQLSSAIEGHGCYPLDNHLLCKNCNMTRIKKLTSTS